MPKFKTFNKLFFKGKPIGKAFIYNKSMQSKNKKTAKAKQDRINRQWNKVKKNSGYKVKTHKIVKK